MRLDQQLQEEKIDGCMEVDEIWKRLKYGISTVAEEICGKEMQPKKQNWMNSEILHKMEERRKCKNMRDEEQYKKLKQEIRKLCRQAKDNYYEDKWKEIEMLDKAHSQLLIVCLMQHFNLIPLIFILLSLACRYSFRISCFSFLYCSSPSCF